jgi:hypothetical protein
MKEVRGEMTILSTPEPGPTYVSTGISVGFETRPAETSTGAVPSNSGIVPDKATIETVTDSGDVTIGTRRLRSSASASGGMSTVVSASVSGAALGRTTMMRTRSMASPNAAIWASEGRTGATATRA